MSDTPIEYTPQLTLTPEGASAHPAPQAPDMAAAMTQAAPEEKLDMSMLSEQEQKWCAISPKIDITDTAPSSPTRGCPEKIATSPPTPSGTCGRRTWAKWAICSQSRHAAEELNQEEPRRRGRLR